MRCAPGARHDVADRLRHVVGPTQPSKLAGHEVDHAVVERSRRCRTITRSPKLLSISLSRDRLSRLRCMVGLLWWLFGSHRGPPLFGSHRGSAVVRLTLGVRRCSAHIGGAAVANFTSGATVVQFTPPRHTILYHRRRTHRGRRKRRLVGAVADEKNFESEWLCK